MENKWDAHPAAPVERLAGNTDTSFLKALALALMLTDHLGVVIFPGVTELRVIGRMAFPLYAWCLVVGSVNTRNAGRYALRMLGLALVSQPLYMLALNHDWSHLNILFLLCLGVVMIGGLRLKKYGSQFWVPACCFLAVCLFDIDYGWRGLMFMLVLYLARGTTGGLAAAYIAYALFWGSTSGTVVQLFGVKLEFLNWQGVGPMLNAFFRLQGMVWLSLPLIVLPTRTGLRMPRWLGYALYPMHLAVLILLRLSMGAAWSLLAAGF